MSIPKTYEESVLKTFLKSRNVSEVAYQGLRSFQSWVNGFNKYPENDPPVHIRMDNSPVKLKMDERSYITRKPRWSYDPSFIVLHLVGTAIQEILRKKLYMNSDCPEFSFELLGPGVADISRNRQRMFSLTINYTFFNPLKDGGKGEILFLIGKVDFECHYAAKIPVKLIEQELEKMKSHPDRYLV